MVLIKGTDKLCAEIAEALGIKNCVSLQITMAVDSIVTVETKFYPEKEAMQKVAAVLKKYNLCLKEVK